jgi:hypothetical protein
MYIYMYIPAVSLPPIVLNLVLTHEGYLEEDNWENQPSNQGVLIYRGILIHRVYLVYEGVRVRGLEGGRGKVKRGME